MTEIVGRVDFDGRRAGGHESDQVVLVHELVANLHQRLLDARRVADLQVLVVDEDDEDASRRVGLRT